MKKAAAIILALALLLSCGAALAGEAPADDAIRFRVWDESGSGSVYMRFDVFVSDQLRAMALACPNEGDDFIEWEIVAGDLFGEDEPADPASIRLECYLGFSDLPPEDAIMQAYAGQDVSQIPVTWAPFTPEFGTMYEFRAVPDEDVEGSYALVPVDDGASGPV